MKRKATAVWQGGLKEGQGFLSTGSGIYLNVNARISGLDQERFEQAANGRQSRLPGPESLER